MGHPQSGSPRLDPTLPKDGKGWEHPDGYEMAELVQYYGTGRRKSSVARVFLRPGSGEFTVNGKPFDVYFVTEAQRIMAKSSLVLTETVGQLQHRLHGATAAA